MLTKGHLLCADIGSFPIQKENTFPMISIQREILRHSVRTENI